MGLAFAVGFVQPCLCGPQDIVEKHFPVDLRLPYGEDTIFNSIKCQLLLQLWNSGAIGSCTRNNMLGGMA